MTLTRRHAVLFLCIAVWNVLSYANFAKNLLETYSSGEERPTGYYVAHIVLIVVNLTIAVVLGRLGIRTWRSTGSAGPTAAPGSDRDQVSSDR